MSYFDSSSIVSGFVPLPNIVPTHRQVLRMDVSLEGVGENPTVLSTPDVPVSAPKNKGKGKGKAKAKRKPKLSIPVTEVTKFLERFTTANIVVVIETHCMENGCFVWTGESADTYKACSLFEVSSYFHPSHHFP